MPSGASLMNRFCLCFALIAAVFAPVDGRAQSAPPSADISVPKTSERYLVAFNKRGPNFADHVNHRDQMLKHRQIYLDLVKSGDIVMSGSLSTEPAMGLILFRAGVDEQAVKRKLNDDFAVSAGILKVEFSYWTILMGGLPDRSANGDV
jgi:hypothetical protein